MRHVCIGCGNEIPEGQEFCYVCGALVKDSLMTNDDGNIINVPYCKNCNSPVPRGLEACPKCGEPADITSIDMGFTRPKKFGAMAYIALFLAIVPGFFNVFGLGQIVMKRWSKAFFYICATIMLYYLAPSLMTTSSSYMLLIVVEMFIFLLSIMDVYNAVLRGES